MKRNTPIAPKGVIRCIIYTRKSTDEGLQQDFNSLDAQRESGEAYIASMKHEGWVCLPDRFDDGGYSGGNLQRPALQRLLTYVKAGKVDNVLVYKVDRISRSIRDFHKIMDDFDAHDVTFVATTQSFSTATSMGRLTLNMLLSFSQFEREMVSDRTRDKIAAARRKGKFAGGKPILGFDLLSSPAGGKLVVNEDEADRVRAIFELYLKHQSVTEMIKVLDERGWTTKVWTTKAGRTIGGCPFDKNLLWRLLTNVVYIGKIRHHEEVFPGEHAAIVDEGTWQRVQALLTRNKHTGGGVVKNKYGALLNGLLHCGSCSCSMGHTFSCKGTKRYRYYLCYRAAKRGWDSCPTKSIPAGEIEQYVVERIKAIGKDPSVLAATVRQVREQREKQLKDLDREARAIARQLERRGTADVELERRATEAREEIAVIGRDLIDEREVATALGLFDPVWAALSPREQARIIQLLVERVVYDGKRGTVSITFHPNGIKALSQELQEAAA